MVAAVGRELIETDVSKGPRGGPWRRIGYCASGERHGSTVEGSKFWFKGNLLLHLAFGGSGGLIWWFVVVVLPLQSATPCCSERFDGKLNEAHQRPFPNMWYLHVFAPRSDQRRRFDFINPMLSRLPRGPGQWIFNRDPRGGAHRSSDQTAQGGCLIIQEVAVHLGPPPPPPPPPTQQANPKHCNLQGGCDFCIGK